MIPVLFILGVLAVGFLIGLLATSTAPMGYEDETGFHFGDPEGTLREELPARLPHPAPAH
jgi:hypothetical protein